MLLKIEKASSDTSGILSISKGAKGSSWDSHYRPKDRHTPVLLINNQDLWSHTPPMKSFEAVLTCSPNTDILIRSVKEHHHRISGKKSYRSCIQGKLLFSFFPQLFYFEKFVSNMRNFFILWSTVQYVNTYTQHKTIKPDNYPFHL